MFVIMNSKMKSTYLVNADVFPFGVLFRFDNTEEVCNKRQLKTFPRVERNKKMKLNVPKTSQVNLASSTHFFCVFLAKLKCYCASHLLENMIFPSVD